MSCLQRSGNQAKTPGPPYFGEVLRWRILFTRCFFRANSVCVFSGIIVFSLSKENLPSSHLLIQGKQGICRTCGRKDRNRNSDRNFQGIKTALVVPSRTTSRRSGQDLKKTCRIMENGVGYPVLVLPTRKQVKMTPRVRSSDRSCVKS